MPSLFVYILKLSLSLSVVFLFYQLVLRKLTFYNWNRWYLLGYTLVCFFIPFIDVSPVLQRNEWNSNQALTWLPAIGEPTEQVAVPGMAHFTAWSVVMVLLLGGMAFMLTRLLVQLISFRRMMKKAKFLSADGMNLYQVDEEIIPFSFGNSIFINRGLHTTEELQEIILHEFVHVKQKHSIDIIWAELLCLVNWYNPFAWLLKKSIRQNLEFIADNKVLENGIGKKQYQYLLLKVIGNNQYSIAPKFNFSSLKKRIAMMNKNKTARLHLVRFLIILPLLALILVSFRRQIGDTLSQRPPVMTVSAATDTIPITNVNEPNEKGYYIDVMNNKGNRTIVVKDKDRKEVERISLNKWKENQEFYTNKYGEIIPPPPPPPATPPIPPTPPEPISLPPDVKSIDVNNNQVTVRLKNGKTEKYDLNNNEEKAAFEKKYGENVLPQVPPRPPRPVRSVAVANGYNLDNVSDNFEITNEKAVINLKNGTTEEYNLTNEAERKKFEDKYGRIISVTSNVSANVEGTTIVKTATSPMKVNVSGTVSTSPMPVTTISSTGGVRANVVPSSRVSIEGTTVTSPSVSISEAPVVATVSSINYDYLVTGTEELVIAISKYTTRQQLDEFKRQMKDKGVTLDFDKIEYDNKNIITHLSGSMKSKDGSSNFSATDFEKVKLVLVDDNGRKSFKVLVMDKKDKEVI